MASTTLDRSLSALDNPGGHRALAGIRRGIEKESLRVGPDGKVSSLPHPAALGSALTHPSITTDFSEAQLELITGVHDSVDGVLAELDEIHRFVATRIGDEVLWSTSMPCMLGRDEDVPVGQYGRSHRGRVKHIYRIGLGNRYGRLMQTISGIHYNFSVPDALFAALDGGAAAPVQGRITAGYFDLIRNFRRHGWLLIWLFGASPAICRTFLGGKPHELQPLGGGTLHAPFGTSLRMGRLGYTSDAQSGLGVSYNGLDTYGAALEAALTRPYPEYEAIGVRGPDGEYRQLGTALLQLENEFYGTIRPKRSTRPGERPLRALRERGVEYVEVRSVDLSPFDPIGIDATQVRFMDVFLLHCLLSDSPPDDTAEAARNTRNQLRVVGEGRRPGLLLETAGGEQPFEALAAALLDACRPIADLLDRAQGGSACRTAVEAQAAKLADPASTPSAQVLDALKRGEVPFFRFAMQQSRAHADALRARPLTRERRQAYDDAAAASLAAQQAIEAADQGSFEEYLADYLSPAELLPAAAR